MRSKPEFKSGSATSQAKDSSLGGCLWMLIVVVGGYFVVTAINRVLSGYGNRNDYLVCYGGLIGFVILLILAKRQGDQEKIRLRAAQQEWKSACKSNEVAIVNRRYFPAASWEDEYGIPHSSRASYHLDLEATAEQRRALYPNLQSVSVEVNESIYSKLIEQNLVRIYYQPEKPMTFLLEAELEYS